MEEERNAVELFPEEKTEAGEQPKGPEPGIMKEQQSDSPAAPRRSGKGKGARRELMSWVMILVVSFLVALFINEVVLINARIISGSMEKTIMTGDRVMGARFAYWFSEPQRQDIVIFTSRERDNKTLIKRIIGVPGDTVEIYDGKVYVNGERLEEPYLWEEMYGSFGPYKVPEGCYFMLGDNRNGSGDSRYWSDPYVRREDILGKALFIYWPHIQGLKLAK